MSGVIRKKCFGETFPECLWLSKINNSLVEMSKMSEMEPQLSRLQPTHYSEPDVSGNVFFRLIKNQADVTVFKGTLYKSYTRSTLRLDF